MAHHLTAVGWSLALATCETSQALLAGGQMFFLGDLLFLPHLNQKKKCVSVIETIPTLFGSLILFWLSEAN